jgi:hypothetical protein
MIYNTVRVKNPGTMGKTLIEEISSRVKSMGRVDSIGKTVAIMRVTLLTANSKATGSISSQMLISSTRESSE